MNKVICDKCGSSKVIITETYRKTVPPRNDNRPSLMPPRRVTYGYKIDEFVCECGNMWEVRK